ncbi:MAG: hypothetical protein HKN23_11140, partial [Verrucomicrobiales bacterium]|nr:hypothetical protein [Verrucomicrobiales bacterium]
NYEVASQLWFDQYLKGEFEFPKTPQLEVNLKTDSGTPQAWLGVDRAATALGVEFYYTQHGQVDGEKHDMDNTKHRFWHYAAAKKHDGNWIADLPVASVDKPLWVFANVIYPLEKPVGYAGYYYRIGESKEFTLSSLMSMHSAEDLKAAGVKAAFKPSLTIESFKGEWEKEWFSYRPEEWGMQTNKLYSEIWSAPEGASLALDVKSAEANKLVITIDEFGVEVDLTGGSDWQTIVLLPENFENAIGEKLESWDGVRNLSLTAEKTLRTRVGKENKQKKFGAAWKGDAPVFRELRWVQK